MTESVEATHYFEIILMPVERGRVASKVLVNCLCDLFNPRQQVNDLLSGWLRNSAMVAKVANVGEMLNEPPLWEINSARRFQCFTEIADRWVLFTSSQLSIRANLCKVSFQYHAGQCTCSPEELVFC